MTDAQEVDAALAEARAALDALDEGRVPRSVAVWLVARAVAAAEPFCAGPLRPDIDGAAA